MAKMQYAVLRCGGEWKIVCERRRIGHFSERTLAVDAAARLAREAAQAGHEPEVLVQDDVGQLWPASA